MKIALALLFTMAYVCCNVAASPIQIVEVHKDINEPASTVEQKRLLQMPAEEQARQSPAAPSTDDDDDEDDDDDDIEAALDDDDDDDDDEEETAASDDDDEDDDEDYFERLFDDILGEDDDDDDDDSSPSTGIVAQPAAAAAAQPQAPIVQSISAGQGAIEEAALAADYPAEAEATVLYDDEATVDGDDLQQFDAAPGDAVKEPELVNVASAPVAQAVVAAAQQSDDDDDDDDDEEGIEDAFDDDDDDEEEDEEEEDDDDDDDDDLIGDDVIEAKRARALDDATTTPEIVVHKFNRFVDGIVGRINKILRRSYDPVSVRLTSPDTKINANAKKGAANRRTTNKSHKTKSRNHAKLAAQDLSTASTTNKTNTVFEEIKTIDPSVQHERSVANPPSTLADQSPPIAVGIPDAFITSAMRGTQPQVKRTKKQPSTAASASSVKSKVANKKSTNKNNKAKQNRPQRLAKGTLYGLSSLKRTGNVRVNTMADYTTVKSNFLLGPLILKVEKSFGRGAKRELKSATATTTEMMGRINLRIVNGAATLHSIKVQQPKQVNQTVQVESADNHDRTREFVWRRSSHIAHVVSQKLTSAARSMLQPPPKH